MDEMNEMETECVEHSGEIPEGTPHQPVSLRGEPEEEGAGPAAAPDFDDFLTRYPHVAPEDIPVQVWQRVERGESLSLAWAQHENQRLRAELERLTAREDALRRSPGSLGGSAREPDEIERVWNEN